MKVFSTMNDDYEDGLDVQVLRSNWSLDYLNELDTSQYPFPNTLWHVKSYTEIAIKTTSMVVVGLTGLILNFIIIMALIKNRWLWTASNILVGNMALIDFISLLFCPWFMLIRDFYQNYQLGNFGCRFEGFLQASLLLAGVGAVMLVSYDRLAAAALTPEARVTRCGAPKLIIVSWILSLAFCLPWIIKREYMEREWLDYVEKYCVEDPVVLNVYWHFVHTLVVWVPLGTMVLTYGAIMWRLERTSRELAPRNGGHFVAKAKGKAMRVSAYVLFTDVVCRIPYSAMIYWRSNNSMLINSVEGTYAALWFAAQFLIYLNSAINPLIYGFTNARFRKAMDRTPGIACCKFGTWCCVCVMSKKDQLKLEDKDTEKIFVIESTPRPNLKLTRMFKTMFNINKETVELSVPKVEEVTTKPTKLTLLKPENV